MPITLKKNQLYFKDPVSGTYEGIDVVADMTTEERIAQINAAGATQIGLVNAAGEEIIDDVEQAVSDAQEAIAAAQTAVTGIEAQRDEIIASIASVAGQGTDTTLTLSGVAADAKATGDEIGSVKSATNVWDSLSNNGTHTISANELEQGQWSYSTKSSLNYNTRIRSQILYPVKAGMSVVYNSQTQDMFFGVLETENANTYISGQSGWKLASANGGVFNITHDGWMTFIVRDHVDNTKTISPADYDCNVNIQTVIEKDYYFNSNALGVRGYPSLIFNEATALAYFGDGLDAGNARVNTFTTISALNLGIQNLPGGSSYTYGTLITFCYNGNQNRLTGQIQIYVTKDGISTRNKFMNGWTEWYNTSDNKLSLHGYTKMIVNASTALDFFGENLDAGNAKINTFATIGASGLGIQNLPGGSGYLIGTLVTFCFDGDQSRSNGQMQIYVNYKGISTRCKFTNGWTVWTEEPNRIFELSPHGFGKFVKNMSSAIEFFGDNLDANNAKVNTFTMISMLNLGIQNLPGGANYTYGTLITYSHTGNQSESAGQTQVYITSSGIFTRLKFYGGWTQWYSTSDSLKTAIEKVENEAVDNLFTTFDSSFLEQGSWAYGQKADSQLRIRSKQLYPVKRGMVVEYYSPTLDTYIGLVSGSDATSMLDAVQWFEPDNNVRYFYVNYDAYMTLIYKKASGENTTVSDFDGSVRLLTMNSRQSLIMPTFNRHTCNIFKRVLCVGDSYTAGTIKESSEASWYINAKYAWPQYMSQLTGNEWINCGSSGANTITWQSRSEGLEKAQAAGRVQAYVIGLGINDSNPNPDYHVDLGTVTDIGTDAQTYYAQMAKIVRELNAISPLAKIFMTTCVFMDPSNPNRLNGYNQAVRDIYNSYKNTYPVHLLDLKLYANLYQNLSLKTDAVSGHQTAIGYEQFAEIYTYVISDYINNHISDFQNVHRIPYDE